MRFTASAIVVVAYWYLFGGSVAAESPTGLVHRLSDRGIRYLAYDGDGLSPFVSYERGAGGMPMLFIDYGKGTLLFRPENPGVGDC
jgi:hypothetical protein